MKKLEWQECIGCPDYVGTKGWSYKAFAEVTRTMSGYWLVSTKKAHRIFGTLKEAKAWAQRQVEVKP